MSGERKQAMLCEIEAVRTMLTERVNRKADELRNRLLGGENPGAFNGASAIIYPLSTMPELFKGRKPAAILFGSERVPVKTWRKAYTLILKRCAADSVCRGRLMELLNKVHGRCRTFLSDQPDGMDVPIEICEGIYAEADFDTGALIRMLTYILRLSGYDYSGISIAVL
jgi:hypothetical protein